MGVNFKERTSIPIKLDRDIYYTVTIKEIQNSKRNEVSIMATSKKEITVIPEATKLSDSILNLPTPPLSVKKTMEKDYMEMIDAAFNVHKNSQILTVLMVGYCIKKLDILCEKAGKRNRATDYRNGLKKNYNLSKKQTSNYKDIYDNFAEDYDKVKDFKLKKEYEGYVISKLAELIVVAKNHKDHLEKFTPQMTVKQIRDKKKELFGDFSNSSVDVDRSSENYSLPASSEQTIYESLTSNIDEGTVEKCINDVKQKYPDKNFNLKITICEYSSVE